MSDLVIDHQDARAPIVRLVAPPAQAAPALGPVATTEAAPPRPARRRGRPWRLPEDDEGLASRAALGRASGWFMPLG